MANSMKGLCCIELNIFSKIIAWCTIILSVFNIFGWFILGFHWWAVLPYMILGPFHIVVSIFLLKASSAKNAHYSIPWLVVTTIAVIMTITHQSLWMYANQDLLHGYDVDMHVLGLLAGFMVVLYLWICIYVHYQRLCSL